MKKSYIIISFLILLLFIPSFIFIYNSNTKEEKIEKQQDQKQDITNDDIPIIDNNSIIDNKEVKETKKDIVEENKNITTTQKTTTKQVETPKKTDSTNTNVNDNETKQEVQEQPKKQSVWDKYGLTEEEYYNKPIDSWQRVDFSVNDYGSMDNAMSECVKYGDNYEPYINGEVAYACSEVSSRSGKQLGIMFSTEKLNN